MARIESLPQPIPFGKYELLERISAGRMGEVFKAKKRGVEGFEKILVVKRIFPHLGVPDFIDAFVNEAKLTVSLSHANIVQVLDLGQHETSYFMAMEYVPGYDLGTCSHILKYQNRAFPLDIAVFTISEVAKGLDYAHRRKDYNFESLNIVHRDMSPPNILISFEGEVKISDFGISRALDQVGASLEPRRQFLYASPEQARGGNVTAQSDIFTLGLMLYHLASGVHPYDHPDPNIVRQNAQQANIRPIHEVADIPRALAQIINSTLAVDLEQRADSAGTLYEELISYLFASGQKADNRSLALFIQNLRTAEAEVFPNGHIPQSLSHQPPGAPSMDDMELDLNDIVEIEPDLHDGAPLNGAGAPGGMSTLERMAGVLQSRPSMQAPARNGMAGPSMGQEHQPDHSAQPEHHADHGQANHQPAPAPAPAVRFDEPITSSQALSSWVGTLANQLSGGAGVGVALEGSLGSGREHTVDRLPDYLHQQGIRPIPLHFGSDHQTMPFTLVTRLLYLALGTPDWALFHPGNQTIRDEDSDVMALGALGAAGVSSEAQGLAHRLFTVGSATLTTALSSLAGELLEYALSSLTADGPVGVVIDGVDNLDDGSWQLLTSALYQTRQRPLALFIAEDQAGLYAHLMGLHDDYGPLLSPLALQGNAAIDEEAVLRGLDSTAMEVLTALALAEGPLTPDCLAEALGRDMNAVHGALGALDARSGLRHMMGERIFLATPNLLSILFDELAVGAMPRVPEIATALTEMTQNSDTAHHTVWSTARMRLAAWSHQRELACYLATEHGRAMRLMGWSAAAMAHYGQALDTFARSELNVYRTQVALAVERADLAFTRGHYAAAQESIAGMVSHATAIGDVTGLLGIHLVQAELCLVQDSPLHAFAWLDDALKRANSVGATEQLWKTRLAMARWHQRHGNLFEAERHGRACLSLLEHHSDTRADVLSEARALTVMTHLLAQAGQLSSVPTHLSAVERLLQRSGSTELYLEWSGAQATFKRFEGALSDAIELAEANAYLAASEGLHGLELRALLEATAGALESGDNDRAKANGNALLGRATQLGHQGMVTRAESLTSLIGVLTSTGDQALNALQGLQKGLGRASEDGAVRGQFDAHYLLYQALNHLGSGADAEHHREEALRFGRACGMRYRCRQIEVM